MMFRKDRWILPRRRKTLTALDMDGRVLRIAQVIRRGNRTVVSQLVAEPLPSKSSGLDLNDPQALGTWMADALRRLKIKPGPVVMGMPRRKVILRPLTLPAIDDMGELAAMVRIQVEKELLFPPSEAVIDFTIQATRVRVFPGADETNGSMAEDDRSKINILVAAANRETVEEYRSLAAAAGFKLHGLGLRPYANVRCVELCKVQEGPGGVALVYLRPQEVNIDVIVGDTLAFSRAASISHQVDAEGPDGVSAATASHSDDENADTETLDPVETICREVVHTLMSYVSLEEEKKIEKVFIAGVTGIEQSVAAALSGRLDMPCGILDPTVHLQLPVHHTIKLAPAAITVIGLAVGANDSRGLPFDFLHPKRAAVKKNPRMRRRVTAAAAVLGVILCALAVRSKLLGTKLEARASLQSTIATLRARTKARSGVIARLGSVKAWQGTDRHWLDHWAYLSAILPSCKDVYVTGLTTTASGTIALSVQARSGEVLADLDSRLRTGGYTVTPLAITPVSDKFGYGFKTTVHLKVTTATTPDLQKHQPIERPSDDTPPVAMEIGR